MRSASPPSSIKPLMKALWLAITLAYLVPGSALAEPRPISVEEIRAKTKKIFDEGGYQTSPEDLPKSRPASKKKQPPLSLPDIAQAPSAASSFIWGALWLFVGVGVFSLLLWLFRERARGAQLRASQEEPGAQTPQQQETPSLSSPSQLAQQGRYQEAIHALLLLAMARLSRRASSLTPSLTSREVLRALHESAEISASMAVLVGAVERSYFGGVPATEEDFARCALVYQKLSPLLPP